MQLSVRRMLNEERNTVSTYACLPRTRPTKGPSEFGMIISISIILDYTRLSEFHYTYCGPPTSHRGPVCF